MSSEGRYIPLEFKPGLFRDPTEYAAEGYWYSGDKIRFKKGLPQSIGGWQKYGTTTFTGIARQVLEWSLLDGRNLLGVGTHNHMYLWYSGAFYNITPVSVSDTHTNFLNVTAGETSVLASVVGHTRSVGDYFDVVSQSTTVGGNVFLRGSYPITTINGANSFTIQTGVTAAATSTAAGGSIEYYLPIASGNQSNRTSYGWGRGSWGSGAWGTPTSSGVVRALRLWSMDNWGEDLIFNYKGGPFYYWDATNTVNARASVITSAPSIVDFGFVSFPARHLVAVGTTNTATSVYDPLQVRWSSSGDYNDWVVSAAGTAGEYRIPSGSTVYSVLESKTEVVIWTDDSIWSMQYVGDPYWFSFNKLGTNCQALSPMSCIDIGGRIHWMSHAGFFRYDGQITPLPCTLQKDIFSYDGAYRIDISQSQKTFAGSNEAHLEIIWFYQSIQSTTGEVDRYVIYNYGEDLWYWGSMERTTWLDNSILNATVATGTDGYLYSHELGLTADNAPLDSYIESAPFDLEEGDKMLFVDRIVPDFSLTGSVQLTFTTRPFPNSPEVTKGPYTITPSTSKVDTRIRGRQAKLKIEAPDAGSAWKLGKTRVRVRDNGKQ